MDRAIANVINGELVPAAGGETYDVIDPSTGQVYASAPLSREEDVDRAFSAAATAFESWRDTTPYERSQALQQARRARSSRAPPEIVDVESRDTGKPKALTMSEEMYQANEVPDVLRRRRAGARGQVGRRVHARPHLDGPA